MNQHEFNAEASFFSDLIITAVEGGIGYWSQVDDYEHGCHGENHERTALATVTVFENDEESETGYKTKGETVTAQSMAKAMRKILRKASKISLHESVVRNMRNALAELDAGMLDAGDCDCIMQVAVLGDVIYG